MNHRRERSRMFMMPRWRERKSRIKSAFKFSSPQDGEFSNSLAETKFLSNRSLLHHADSRRNLRASQSFGVQSEPGSETSPGNYTPTVNGISHKSSLSDCMCFLSPMRDDDIPTEFAAGSYVVVNNQRLRDSDDCSDKLRNDNAFLTRKLELSELELHTLRKKVAKESRRGQDLAKENSLLKSERDELKRKCEELKLAKTFQRAEQDLLSVLEETRNKLNYEKDTNEKLIMQLGEMQEANSQFISAIRDLDGLLKQGSNEFALCSKCRQLNTDDDDFQELENEIIKMQKSACNGVLLDAISETESREQYALVELVGEPGRLPADHLLEDSIIALNNELILSEKDRQNLEKQMEQLALDNEILKQENHSISAKLEESMLQKQLQIRYDCTAHLQIIDELQAQIKHLMTEVEKQNEAFENDLATILRDKVEQEKRALLAEEELTKLRISNANTTILVQEEVKRLSALLSSTFIQSEKFIIQSRKETCELRRQKGQLEQLLLQSNQSLAFIQGQYHGKIQQLLGLIDYESKETDRLILRLKDKHQELEDYRISQEAKLDASSEEIQSLKSQVEITKAERDVLSEKLQMKEVLSTEGENVA